jgi:adenylosuccinate lyase
VGTSASYAELFGAEKLADFESRLSAKLDLPFFPIASQTYPRHQDFPVVNALAALAASLHKFAFDLRLLQSPVIGETSEPFGVKQVGSSAMPFKRNPIRAEKIDSSRATLPDFPASPGTTPPSPFSNGPWTTPPTAAFSSPKPSSPPTRSCAPHWAS